MKKIYLKINKFLKIFFKIKFKLHPPKKSQILIFDRRGSSSYIYKDILNSNYEVLSVLGEELNLFILSKLLFKLKMPNLQNYINEYIKIVQPKFIFHNSFNIRFFQLDKKNFKVKFIKIFTQSEMRNKLDHEDSFANEKFFCDHLLVWSNSMKELIEKNVTGNFIVCGSYRNNMGPKINKDQLENKLAFISQWRPFEFNNKRITVDTKMKYWHERLPVKFSWNDIFQNHLKVALNLKDFCIKSNIDFEVIGCSVVPEKIDDEIKFFRDKLGENDWKFVKSSKEKRGHYLTNNSKYVVTMDSTLGYECFARGQRVIFFSLAPNLVKYDYAKFGWPMKTNYEGKFWTTSNTEKDFLRLTDYLINASDEDWEESRNDYEDFLHYNFDNTKFKNFFRNLGLLNE